MSNLSGASNIQDILIRFSHTNDIHQIFNTSDRANRVQETRKTTRHCRRCKKDRPSEEFYRGVWAKDPRRSTYCPCCRTCREFSARIKDRLPHNPVDQLPAALFTPISQILNLTSDPTQDIRERIFKQVRFNSIFQAPSDGFESNLSQSEGGLSGSDLEPDEVDTPPQDKLDRFEHLNFDPEPQDQNLEREPLQVGGPRAAIPTGAILDDPSSVHGKPSYTVIDSLENLRLSRFPRVQSGRISGDIPPAMPSISYRTSDSCLTDLYHNRTSADMRGYLGIRSAP